MQPSTGLTNLQQELLKLYSFDLPAQELKELKDALAHFFADKAVKAADQAWEKKELSNSVMDRWLNESK
jgi:hypothetical protein